MLHQIWHRHQIVQKFQILYPENTSVITVSNGISCYWIPLFSLNQLLQQLPILITASTLSVATQLTKRTCPTTKQNPITRSPRKLCSCLSPPHPHSRILRIRLLPFALSHPLAPRQMPNQRFSIETPRSRLRGIYEPV